MGREDRGEVYLFPVCYPHCMKRMLAETPLLHCPGSHVFVKNSALNGYGHASLRLEQRGT